MQRWKATEGDRDARALEEVAGGGLGGRGGEEAEYEREEVRVHGAGSGQIRSGR